VDCGGKPRPLRGNQVENRKIRIKAGEHESVSRKFTRQSLPIMRYRVSTVSGSGNQGVGRGGDCSINTLCGFPLHESPHRKPVL
jgi:hypothetical protein